MKTIYVTGIFILLISVGYIQRMDYISNSYTGRNSFLQSDPNAFYNYGLTLPYPCLTVSRPPVFPVFTRFILYNFGDMKATTTKQLNYMKYKLRKTGLKEKANKILENHNLLRETGIILNIVAMTFMFTFIYYFAGWFSSLLCTLFWCLNYYSIFYSTMYFRIDFVTALNLLILFIFIDLIQNNDKFVLKILGLVLLCATVSLTRLSALTTSFLAVLSFNFTSLIFKKWKIKCLWMSISIMIGTVTLVSPYLIYNYRNTGEIAPVMNHHAKFWRNQEFAGKEGYPIVKEVARNPYCGPDITSFEYVFKEHSFFEVIYRYLKGYWVSLIKYIPECFTFYFNGIKYNFTWLLLFILPGIIYCVSKKEVGLTILLFGLIVLFPFAFILPLNEIFSPDPAKNIIGVEPRFNMPVMPYVFMLTAIGIGKLLEYAFCYVKKFVKRK